MRRSDTYFPSGRTRSLTLASGETLTAHEFGGDTMGLDTDAPMKVNSWRFFEARENGDEILASEYASEEDRKIPARYPFKESTEGFLYGE